MIPTSSRSSRVPLDLSSLGGSVGSSSTYHLTNDTDRITLPSLCSPERPSRFTSEDYFSGDNAGLSRDKIAVWDSATGNARYQDSPTLPLPHNSTSDAVRRKLHTPPEIRRRIHAVQEAKRMKLEAERVARGLPPAAAPGGAIVALEAVPGSATSDPRSRDGLKSRARSGAASREIARRILEDRQKQQHEKEKAMAKKIKAAAAARAGSRHTNAEGASHHHASNSHNSHVYLHGHTEAEREARRVANEKRRQEKGQVETLRKKPVSPPRTATRTTSAGGLFGSLDTEPPEPDVALPEEEDRLELEPTFNDLAPFVTDDSTAEADAESQDRDIDDDGSINTIATPVDAKEQARVASKKTIIESAAQTLQRLRHANDAVLQGNYSSYFGSAARSAMRAKFLTSAAHLRIYPKDEALPEALRSPRSLYLREVAKKSLLPLQLTVRKHGQPRGVFLGGRGLGDERMLPIVSVIDTLPAVETIDVSDNRMTDISLVPLTLKLTSLKTLTHLDLSFNKMDDSAKTVMDFIRDPLCTLKTLILSGADVDDYECCHLCDAIIENGSIETLGLSRNLLGNDEHRKVLEPDVQLAGDGLAKMLLKNRKLTSLDLSWNSLRATSACAIGRALKRNRRLKSIYLQFNSFGDLGTQNIGYALKYNRSLTEIDLSNNSIVPRSACVLANALSHNETLSSLNLNDNVLGRVGGQAVVAAIQRSQDLKRIITFSNCDCAKEDPSLFDPAKPQGHWTLDLAEPYGQMIVEECFFLANFRAGCSIEKLEHKNKVIPLKREEIGKQKFSLKDMHKQSKAAAKAILASNWSAAANALDQVLTMFGFSMDHDTCKLVVKKVAEHWKAKQARKNRTEDLHEVFLAEVFFALFIINDEDLSGTMELDEFISTLESLGMTTCDPLTAKLLMDEHDREGTGSISGSEFAMIMVNEFCRTDQPRGVMVEKSTGQPWPIAASGNCELDVRFVIEAPSVFDVGSDEGVETLLLGITSARTSEQKDIMFAQACTSPYFFLTSDQAQLLLDTSLGAGLSKLPLDMIVAILPQIVNEEQVNRFLDMNLTDAGKLALRIKMGPLYNAFTGLPTGHYFLDLSTVLHRMGSKRLAAVSVSETKATRAAGANLSQKGNWTNFRNEVMGNNYYSSVPLSVNGQWFADCPETGELRFDYVSTRRVLVGTSPLADNRFEHLITHMGLESILRLQPVAEQWAQDLTAAQEALQSAQAALVASGSGGNMRELMRIKELKDALKDLTKRASEVPCVRVDTPLSLGSVKEQYNEIMDTCHHYLDILPREKQRDMSRFSYNPDPNFRPDTPEVLLVGPKPNKRAMPAIYPYAYRKILELQIQMPVLFFSVEQAVRLMSFFPSEGYLRVQVLLTVFGHLVDAECLSDIYDNHLSPDERAELVHRVGILCIIDPVKPDREYKLDLRRWDQREMCKILIQLGINEPGDNWLNEGEYRWSKYDDPVPGWILPAPWATPDESSDGDGGPRHYGWLRVTYTSTDKGCEINSALRRNQRRRTLAGMKSLL